MSGALEAEVKRYLACWFQLGKKVVSEQQQTPLFPQPIFREGNYSPEFESCWHAILSSKKNDFYLEGTDCSVKDLLTPAWEIIPCARCEMPIALKTGKVASPLCPCSDLMHWPNTELPKPRSPVDSQEHLQRIRNRLNAG
ncbi:hypothetical protein [Oscillatoria sp. FACHB-1406]|uniref:hypothetical protein n=1 Tax=Oscillatoria sp. FACHB-1406 TaxID=2692846 RepID=UPI001688CFBF|nr:hypothetical protein [Oscillatoria sp. FACHB-1406]MBD2580599.1 hypothetical protein [Oscillatoria sp. FACHB-1406]